jgi:4'-phosphopantetheinyl transferase EntD
MENMENNGACAMGPVATLDSAALNGRDYIECFCASERRKILSSRNIQRRREYVAGRLAAKFLFLNQHSAEPLAAPSPIHLTRALLDRFNDSEYRSAEVFRSDEVRAGLPRISWPGGKGAQSVAIAHTNGLACAFLGNEAAVSVDMERAEARTPGFYSGTFTSLERRWAGDVSSRLRLHLAWVFTFLWTAKECLLKTPWFHDLSIADLASINVLITSGEEQLVQPHFARDFLAGFVFLQADAADRSRVVPVNLAVSGRHDLVLTALQRRSV